MRAFAFAVAISIVGLAVPAGAMAQKDQPPATPDPNFAGTFNGNPLTTAAGCASLDLLSEGEIDRINRLGDRLAAALDEALEGNGLDARVTNVGSLVHVHVGATDDIESFKDVDLHSEPLSELHVAALAEGIYFAPRGMLNVSTPMDEQVIADAAEAFGRAAARTADFLAGSEQVAAR